MTTLNGNLWFRESTQEWVFEVEFRIPDYITSINRYTGNTQIEALECFQEMFPAVLAENLELIGDIN